MKSSIFRSSLLGAALLWSPSAFALTCGEIMNMVNVNVPMNIIVQTITDSGESFTADDVRCLTNDGAPAEIVTAVKARSASKAVEAAPEAEPEPTKTTTTSKSKSSFADDEAIGSTKKTSTKELADEGDESEGADPAKLDEAIKAYKAKKPSLSSQALYEMLKADQYPDKKSKILFYLASSLYDMGMYHTAQYYFIEVLKRGTSDHYFKYALPKLVAISRATGDESDLVRIVAKIPADEYPRSARNQLYYLLGVRLYENGKLTESRQYFEQLSEKSDLYTRAKFLEGQIYNDQGKLKSAVRSFTEVVKTQGEAATAQELDRLDRLRDLSLLNIARIYYSIERYKDATTWYGYVDRDSAYWPQAQFESAWANFMVSDLNLTLGQLLTVESPHYKEHEYLPEATILRALTFFNLCEFDDVDRLLTDFDGTYKPMHAEMKDFLKRYSSDEGKKIADEAFDRYFGEKTPETTLPQSLFVKLLRNTELAGLVEHIDMMEAEEAKIAAQKSAWRDTLGEELQRVINDDRARLKRRAGLVLLAEMVKQTTYLGDLLTQANFIKFEVKDARRADYAYRASTVDLPDAKKSFSVDFATSPDIIYWPFNGEFWADELGYYRYTEQGSCK